MDSRHQILLQNEITSSPSPEMFSFPGTPNEAEAESERGNFEFESARGSPSRTTGSPADRFFLNGRLLPHDFPTATTKPSSRSSFSGTTNVMNNHSMTSSRSNSTNSTTYSSARTSSSSDVSDRGTFQKQAAMKRGSSVKEHFYQRNNSGSAQLGYRLGGSTRRWQFITPAPVLGPSRSRRGPTGSPRSKKRDQRKRSSGGNSNGNEIGGFLHRVLRSLVCGDL